MTTFKPFSLSIAIMAYFALHPSSIAAEPIISPPIPTQRPPQTEFQNITVLDGGWCVAGNECTGPVPITREGFFTCEENCTLRNPVPVEGIDATLFDVSCKGDWGGFEYLMMLKEYEDSDGSRRAVIIDSDGAQNLERCSAPAQGQSTSQCDFNSRLYRASADTPNPTGQYHELQFVDGFTSGTVTITEYRGGKAIWRATGEHACSNGTGVCSLVFPVASGGVVEAPFEVLTDERDDYSTIVAPAFSQNIYLSGRNATDGKRYGGLVADLLNGYVPAENDLFLPRNVYEFVGCGPS